MGILSQIAHSFSSAIIGAAALAAGLVVAVPATWPSLTTDRNVFVVRDIDPGGNVGTYDIWWKRVADSGALVVVDGTCISACTMLMGLIPPERVCLTDRASFGLHVASVQGPDGARTPALEFTAHMVRRYYPQVVRDFIESHGGLKEELMFMLPADFKGFYRQCKPGEYNPWPAYKTL